MAVVVIIDRTIQIDHRCPHCGKDDRHAECVVSISYPPKETN